jgi:hypothetical protein
VATSSAKLKNKKLLDNPVEIDRGKAALAAVPQAALDVAGNFIPLAANLLANSQASQNAPF